MLYRMGKSYLIECKITSDRIACIGGRTDPIGWALRWYDMPAIHD